MPIYEYQCQKCGYEFERNAKMSDPAPQCPHQEDGGPTCEGETKKLISKSSFQLKGGGWYKDGY